MCRSNIGRPHCEGKPPCYVVQHRFDTEEMLTYQYDKAEQATINPVVAKSVENFIRWKKYNVIFLP